MIQQTNNPTKFTREFDSEFSRQIWKYDLSIAKNGPISVTIHHKENKDWKTKMTLGDYAKLARKGKL